MKRQTNRKRNWQRYFSIPFLASRIRENGIIWCFRAVILTLLDWIQKKQSVRFTAWWLTSIRSLIFRDAQTEKRLLLIWDLSLQPYSIGDFLLLQEIGLVMRDRKKINKIDICIVGEAESPKFDAPEFRDINTNNYHIFLSALFPVALVNESLGSFLVFDSQNAMKRYVADNMDFYEIWPSAYVYRQGYMPARFWQIVTDFYNDFKYIPHLNSHKAVLDWAHTLIVEQITPNVPVTVHLRNNPQIAVHRNSNTNAWLELFTFCENRFPVVFIVICGVNEIDDRIRNYTNVIVAKDFHTDIERDMALMEAAAFHMGMVSGPATKAIFSDKPFVLFNWQVPPEERPGLFSRSEQECAFNFSTDQQKFFFGSETAEMLIQEFEQLFSNIDVSTWKNQSGQDNYDVYTETTLMLR